MTEPQGVHVSSASGPVHTGAGHQFVLGWGDTRDLGRVLRRGVDPRQVVREHRTQLSRRFIPPSDYHQAVEQLAAPGAVVLLDGAPGIGRRAAATMLLHQLDGVDGRFEELSTEPEENGPEADAGDRFLFDLSDVSDGDYPTAQRLLAAHRATVETHGARLVAVLPSGKGHLLDPEFTPLVVQLGRPRGMSVFCQHLRVDRVPYTPEQLAVPELRGLLDGAPMRELAALAGMMRRARDSGRYGDDFTAWCAEAVAAVTNRTDEVARQVNAHRTADDRSLLLSAAMLSGASADAVFHGARLLLSVLRHEADATPRLGQADLGEQLGSLRIGRDHEGRVSFERLAYDGAVRTHFWTNFPDLRAALCEWVGGVVALPDLTADDRKNLVARFAEQALAHREPQQLVDLAIRWTQPARPLRSAAAAALEHALHHERYGARTRSQIYRLATARERLAPDLVLVLAEVCRDVIGATHPEQALVRLHHLALRPGGEETRVARAHLLDIGRGGPSMYRRLVQRILQGPRVGYRHAANLEVLTELMEPAELSFEPPWSELRDAWEAVMTQRRPQEWSSTLGRWLTAAEEREEWAPALDVLPAAAASRVDLLDRLYVITCEWVRSEPAALRSAPPHRRTSREAMAARIWHGIDRAQDADVLNGGAGPYESGENP
ncbi:hypothetical protein ACFVIM_02325 [Streptomyces sp. NPDC057638]|uniref:hypothetical protein n=1 Tax=Streptomyces sp. NPDC057638 TaxID=3346190 RepID=UPI0036B69F33